MNQKCLAQLAGAAEYTDCISAGEKESPNECPGYDTKQSDGEALVMLEFWGMWSTLSLPSLASPLCLRVVAPDRALSMRQTVYKLNWIVWNRTVFTFNCVFILDRYKWNHLTVKKELRFVLWPRKGSLMKAQTCILDNRLYYTRKIELHRKGKKSRTVWITPILICLSGSEISQY